MRRRVSVGLLAAIAVAGVWVFVPFGRAADDDAAKEAYYKKMTEAATAKWPEIEAKFKPEEGFDATDPAPFKGKLIRVETDNLMGYRFKPGDFPFATTLSGNPVAAKYDPTVAAAVAQVEKKLGRSLGDDDNDGKWVIIARVEGTKGKLQRRVKIEGTDIEKAETVDAAIVTIVAGHIGPMAAGKDIGMVKEDKTIGKP